MGVSGQRRRLPRLKLVVALAALLLGVACGVQLIAATLLEDPSQRPPCLAYPQRVHAVEVHLVPGLIQHQSWVDFPVPRTFTGYFAFCVDGRLLSAGGGELDFHTGTARFNVSTTWVDLEWLRGGLDGYLDRSRWELRLVCDPQTSC